MLKIRPSPIVDCILRLSRPRAAPRIAVTAIPAAKIATNRVSLLGMATSTISLKRSGWATTSSESITSNERYAAM